MPKFRVTTTEHRVYRVVYEVDAEDADHAEAAIEDDGIDARIEEEHLNIQETTQITYGPVEEIPVEELALR